MDDWTYLYPDAAPDTQPALLDQDWRASEDRRLRAQQAEPPRIADLEQAPAWEGVDDGRSVLNAPLPFQAPARNSLTY